MSYRSLRESWVYARARDGWPLDAIRSVLRDAGVIRRAHEAPGTYEQTAEVEAMTRVTLTADAQGIRDVDIAWGRVRIAGEDVPAAGWRKAQIERRR